MKFGLYSIYDVKANFFSSLMTVRAERDAVIEFEAIRSNPKSTIHQYPDDFLLMRVGQFDSSNGQLVQLEVPQHVSVPAQSKLPID